jgi:hypothetical protein
MPDVLDSLLGPPVGSARPPAATVADNPAVLAGMLTEIAVLKLQVSALMAAFDDQREANAGMRQFIDGQGEANVVLKEIVADLLARLERLERAQPTVSE